MLSRLSARIACSARPEAETGAIAEVMALSRTGRRSRSPQCQLSRPQTSQAELALQLPFPAAKRSVVVEHDFHGNSLNDLREVACRIVRRQQSKGAAPTGRPSLNVATQHQVWKGVDRHACRLTSANVGHLRFLEVRDDPNVGERDDGNQLSPNIDKLAYADLALADHAFGRGNDPSVGEVVGCEGDLRFCFLDLRLKAVLHLAISGRSLAWHQHQP